MKIKGGCHCGNIRYSLHWPDGADPIPVRECGCTFCRKHGGAWTSNPGAELDATCRDADRVSRYRFGTETAEFYLCSRCGVPPFVISDIDGRLYAVVNINTFEDTVSADFQRSATDFDGETTNNRLDRRRKNWISQVRITLTNT